MKRCPQCGREYDATMSFCLDDGAELLYGPASADEPATAILSVPPAVAGGLTGARDESELRTAILQPPATAGGSDTAEPLDLVAAKNSIAVLPFAHMSADEDNEYFCDGLAEEILNALAKIDGLKVAARTSAFSFKNKDAGISEIGEKLGVKNILEGSVRKSGNRLRITAQLVNASDGYHLWSERYDREMKDIFDVQDDITLAVVEALKVKLLGEEKAAVLKRHTENAQALDFYLRGMSYFAQFTPEFFAKAIDNYQRAISLDPNYAAAYAGLAESYSEMSFFGSGHEWIPKAKEAARKAVELDESLGNAHNALAVTLMYYDRDYARAEREYKRALELEPGSAHIHMWYGWFLGLTRRFDEGLERMKRAQEFDPLGHLIAFGIGAIYLWSGQQARAIEQLTRLTELNPSFPLAYSYLAEAYVEKGDFDTAVSTVKSAPVPLDDPISLSAVAYVYARANQRQKAIGILDNLEAADRADGVDVQIAKVYVGLGDHEQAFAWLEKARDDNSVWLTWTGVDPAFDPIRTDPRYQALLKWMGLDNL